MKFEDCKTEKEFTVWARWVLASCTNWNKNPEEKNKASDILNKPGYVKTLCK